MKIRSRFRSLDSRRRSAVVTVMVLVVLLLLSGMVVAFVRRAIVDRRQMRNEFEHQQAIQLADAGVDVLRHSSQASSDYAGETWEILAGTIHQTNTGKVVISVKDQAATVTARYPANAENPFQVTRTVRLSE